MCQRRSYVFAADGSIIWDVIGADSEDEGTDDEDGADEGDLDGDDDEDGDEGDGEEDGDETVETLKTKLADMEDKYNRTFRRMQRADRAKTLANKKLQDYENGDGAKELAAAKAKITELETKLASAGGQDKSTIVREEFRDMDGFSWHNPKLAFSLLELDEVDVDEKTGKVDPDSLKDAMKDLAKNHPYLVKAKTEKPGKDEETEEDEKPASGANFSGKRRKNNLDKAALARKFPALASRS